MEKDLKKGDRSSRVQKNLINCKKNGIILIS